MHFIRAVTENIYAYLFYRSWQPLYTLLSRKNVAKVSVLMTYHNTLNATVPYLSGYYNCPLGIAIESSQFANVKFLLETGADTTRISNRCINYSSLETWKVTMILVRWEVFTVYSALRLSREVLLRNTEAMSLYLTTGVYPINDLRYTLRTGCIVLGMMCSFQKQRHTFSVLF